MNFNCHKLNQVPLVTRKQAEADAITKGMEGLVIGLAAGLVIGTTVALLTAPKSGKDARQCIRDKRNCVVGKTGAAACKVKDGAACIGGKVKTKFAKIKHHPTDDEVIICTCCDEDAEDLEEIVDEILSEDQEAAPEEKAE